ncbi:MAG: hypothetical protein J6K38_04985 [Alistipes sp.]|nr:hypothetical protein [Alistipes sp.]
MTLRAGHIAAAACAVWLASCSSGGTTVEMHDMDDLRWSEAAQISVDNDDTLSMRTLSVVVRYNRRLQPDSVCVDIATLTPDSLRLEERFTLHIPPTDEVRPVERVFPYRRHARLMRQGTYRFTITPSDEIAGIESVGLMIDNAD